MIEDLKRKFETGTPVQKLEVVRALESSTDYQSVALLIHALDDPDHDVRETARDILRSFHHLMRPASLPRVECCLFVVQPSAEDVLLYSAPFVVYPDRQG